MSDIVVVEDPPAARILQVIGGVSGEYGAIITPEGGIAVPLINSTGAPSVKGSLVHITAPGAVGLTALGVPDTIGVVYTPGIADGDLMYVVVSGIAEVLFIGQTTAGHFARTFVSSESASFQAGKALSEAVPSSPFATDKHFCEIGHILQTIGGAGLAKVILHFN